MGGHADRGESSRRCPAEPLAGRTISELQGGPAETDCSWGNFQEALKCRQGKGGCPILEVDSLVIYSSMWVLELQSHK